MAVTAHKPQWFELHELTQRCVPWDQIPQFADLDPYLAWADASRFANLGANPCPEKLPYLIKVSAVKDEASHVAEGPAFEATGASASGDLAAAVFVTGLVTPAVAVNLRPGQTIRISLLPGRWQFDLAGVLSLPRIRSVDPRLPPIRSQALVGDAPQPLMAIIDDGCPFAHAAYRATSGVGSRVMALWDQGADCAAARTVAGQLPVGFGYGLEFDKTAISDAIKAGTDKVTGSVDEDACYDAIAYDLVGSRFRHGAQTMGVAAGSPNPFLEVGDEHLDEAAEADIVFVQLPRETMADTSGGSLPVRVLDALRYIDSLSWVTRESDGAKLRRPLLVNLSVGAVAGPHDGTSLVEQAIDDFLSHRPLSMVVLPAGNAREARLHTAIVVPPGKRRTLGWLVAPDNASDSFMELWLPPSIDPQAPTQLTIRLIPPEAPCDTCPEVEPGAARFLVPAGADQAAVCGVVNALTASNSRNGAVVLLAVGPTASDGSVLRAMATAGEWTVEIYNPHGTAVVVEAWIERADPTFGGATQQSEFSEESLSSESEHSTLNSLAHAQAPVVVGGYSKDLSGRCILDDKSGEGPGRLGIGRPGPDLIAPSDESPEQSGLLSYGVHTGEWIRMRGTSVSAAIVTRRLFNEWAKSPPATGDSPHVIKANLPIDIPRDPSTEPLTRVGEGRVELFGG